MITNGHKTSYLIDSQLPEYIRDNDEYKNFRLFLQAYYEWMEQNGNVIDKSKNLLNYSDIDKTSSDFLDYYVKDFLPYFPEGSLISKQQAVKLAKQLYQSKGTPASYKFLFRVLYDSDFEYFNTKDVVLKASDGEWYVAKSLKLATNDARFLKIQGLRIFGEISKSVATIENTVFSGTKTEVFISNIERLFQSGEMVRVVDNNNQDVTIDGEILRAKLVGQISQITINPNNRGLLYNPGDPVVLYNGLNPDIVSSYDATAVVGDVTTGTIQNINVVNEGYGYVDPNTIITIVGGGASALPGSFDPNPAKTANLSLISNETINLKRDYTLGDNSHTSYYHFSKFPNANSKTRIIDALGFSSFVGYPLSSVLLTNGGGGLKTVPQIYATSQVTNDEGNFSDIGTLGILAPIQIRSGGNGYVAGDTIIITGGSGYGAHANVKSVTSNGTINAVQYIANTADLYPIGGTGYRLTALPSLTVLSSNTHASGADLYVDGIIGQGATFKSVVNRVGSISTINIIDAGEDYVSAPSVSLRVQDIIVSNISIASAITKNDIIYQGTSLDSSTYRAIVNNVTILVNDAVPENTLYNLRVFEYTTKPDPTKQLIIQDKNINLIMYNAALTNDYDSTGVRTYGNGLAKANASFLNGLSIGQGQYLSARGQPSSFSVLQDLNHNNFTYQITVQKELSKYKDVLLNLLHPAGMKLLGRYTLESKTDFNYNVQEALYSGQPLDYYTQTVSSNATMSTDFTTKSTNIIKFNNIGTGTNIANFIFANSVINLTPTNGTYISSEVQSINYNANTVTLKSNTWLTFMNVATITACSSTKLINITSLTGTYDIINNGNYTDYDYPLKDIIYSGDKIQIADNPVLTVDYVDYINGVIHTTQTLVNDSNSLLSVNRTFSAGGTLQTQDQVKIFGPLGTVYYPELTTENNSTIITEDGNTILLG